MAGVLQFTLGLETSKFIGQIQGAALSLGRFLVDGVAGAISTGSRLEDLAKRTGETVSNLYGLEKAFKAAGLEGGSVSTVLFQMNKAMGGFSEFGQPTKDIFASMGLDVEKLKASGGAEALFTITDAMAKLSQSEATKAGGLIFGRGGAGDAIQLSRSMKEARAEFEASAKAGAMLERNAEAFDKIEKTMEKVKNKSKGLFFGIAEGAAPGIQMVLDILNKIDLKNIGQAIGSTLGSIVNTIKDGQIGMLLQLSLGAAAESFGNILVATIAGAVAFMSARMADAFTNLPKILSAGLAASMSVVFVALAAGFDAIGQTKIAGKLEAIGTEQLFKAHKSFGEYVTGDIAGLTTAAGAGMKAFSENGGMFGGDQATKLKEFLDSKKLTFPEGEAKDPKAKLLDVSTDKTKAAHQASADSLTRIGAFQGGGNAQSEAIRQTATHTRTTAQKMTSMLQFLENNNKVFGNPYGNIS